MKVNWDLSTETRATYLEITINSVAATNTTTGWTISPVGTFGPLDTIPCHVSGIATLTTDDIGGEVALLRAVILAMANLTAVLTSLVLIVTKGAVEGSKFSELFALQIVLILWDGGGL